MIELIFSEDDLTPPPTVSANARRGLELREAFGRGGTEVGVRRAEQLASGAAISAEDVRTMYGWFARHAVNSRSPRWRDEQNPSAGWVAWLLWGGDEARAWIAPLRERLRDAEALDPDRRPRSPARGKRPSS